MSNYVEVEIRVKYRLRVPNDEFRAMKHSTTRELARQKPDDAVEATVERRKVYGYESRAE